MAEARQRSLAESGIVFCVAAMAFTFQFDAALVTVSLPDMARELSVPPSRISLVLLSYLMGAVIAFLPAGKLGDKHGLRVVCLGGCLTATIGTVLCGFSHSLESLVLGRLVQGIGSGGFVAVGYAMIPAFVRREHVGWGYGMQSLGAGLGMLAGVPVGGLLSRFLTWQWIFLASIPMFALLLLSCWRIVPRPVKEALASDIVIPWLSIGLLSASMTGLTFLLGLGSSLGWASLPVLSAAVVTGGLAVSLWLVERSTGQLISRELMRSYTDLPAYGAMLLMAAVVGGVRFVLPFYLEVGCGLGILASSYLLLVHPLCYGPVSLVAGRLSDHLGSRPVVLAATAVCALSAVGFALSLPMSGIPGVVMFMVAFGIATGLFFAPGNRLIMAPVPKSLRGEAGGVLSIVFNFGTLLGVALFQMVLMPLAPGSGATSDVQRELAIAPSAFAWSIALGGLIALAALFCSLRAKARVGPASIGSAQS